MNAIQSVFGKSLSKPKQFAYMSSSVKRAVRDSDMSLSNVEHGIFSRDMAYAGMGLIDGHDGALLAWRCSENYRVGPQLWLGYCWNVDHGPIGMCRMLKQWTRRGQQDDIHYQIVRDRLEKLTRAISILRSNVSLMKSTELSEDVMNTAMINMVRDGILMPSRLESVLSYIDNTLEPTGWDLYAALCASVSPVSDTNVVKPLFDRSPAMYQRCVDLCIEDL